MKPPSEIELSASAFSYSSFLDLSNSTSQGFSPPRLIMARMRASSAFYISCIILCCCRIEMAWKICETPSMMNRMIPPRKAYLNATEAPPRMDRMPPVMKPAAIALYGSSFCRNEIIMHSIDEKMPPQRPKFPPRKGALFRTWHNPL